MADIKLFAVQNNLGITLSFQNLETPGDNTQLPTGRGYTYGRNGAGCDVPECDSSNKWANHRMVFGDSGAFALNLFKQGSTLYYSLGTDYPAALTAVPGTPDTSGQRNLLVLDGTTSSPTLEVSVLPPSYYRLELWFDWNDPAAKIGWGVTQSSSQNASNPTVLGKTGGLVQLYDASVSQLDITVFDATAADGGSRTLQNVEIDFESTAVGAGSDPIGNARALRGGLSGNAFSSGPQTGGTIYSYPGGARTARCNWDSRQSYQKLTDGDYTFTGAIRVSSGTTQKQFSIDPEMDISG